MAITSFPFDDQDTSEDQYSRLFRELQDSGVADSSDGQGFKVTADSTGMWVDVHPGFALVRGHAILSTEIERVPVPPSTTATRIDRVVLRLDPAENHIVFDVLEGTPGSGAPALTQTDTGIHEDSLGRVSVGANVTRIDADRVTDERLFVGHRVGSWSTDTRPANPRKARLGLNSTTGRWEFWTGSAWADLTPSTVDNAVRWGGYSLTVSSTTPTGAPTADRIWIQPIG